MITGSHNPPDHNGFKICLGKQTLFGEQIQEIKRDRLTGGNTTGSECAAAGRALPTGRDAALDVLADYVADVVSRASLGPRKLKVVVDAGNGMGGVTAVPVYEALGVELIELYTEPDSTFPNHHPDPTVDENLLDLIAAVTRLQCRRRHCV